MFGNVKSTELKSTRMISALSPREKILNSCVILLEKNLWNIHCSVLRILSAFLEPPKSSLTKSTLLKQREA